MAYTPVPIPSDGDPAPGADWINTYLKANFEAGVDLLTTKGDILPATAADAAARLGIGANGTYLHANSSQSGGLQWRLPSYGAQVYEDAADSIANGTEEQYTPPSPTENFDIDSTLASPFAYTARATGYYFVSLSGRFDSFDENEIGYARIYVGAVAGHIFAGTVAQGTSATGFGIQGATVVSLTSGDVLKIYLYQNKGVAQNFTVGNITVFRIA